MASSAEPKGPAGGPGDRYRSPGSCSRRARLRSSKKRTQSNPLGLSDRVSARCTRFLEIEAIGPIWLTFINLQRNRGRFLGAEDRHAPGFVGKGGAGPAMPRKRSWNVLWIQGESIKAAPTHQDWRDPGRAADACRPARVYFKAGMFRNMSSLRVYIPGDGGRLRPEGSAGMGSIPRPGA
jgi:hypothetical protein